MKPHLKNRPQKQSRQDGFTLIEVMIVVAIIGILAAIAYPNYQESVAKGRRASGLKTLTEASQYMRRIYAAKDSFTGVTLPTGLASSPNSGTAEYTMKFVNSTSGALVTTSIDTSAFVIRMTRSGTMASDRCGDLQIDNTGTRVLKNVPTGSTATLSACFPGN